MGLFQHILVPVDGSSHAVKALKFALELAHLTKADMEVLHVMDTAQIQQISRLTDKNSVQVHEEMRERAMAILVDANALAREAGLEIMTHMIEGTPYEAVVEHAHRRSSDLIVIGRIGTRGPRRILIGSVTERILEIAPCHVLVVR